MYICIIHTYVEPGFLRNIAMGNYQLTWDVDPSLLYSCLAIFISLLLYHTNRYRSCIYIYNVYINIYCYTCPKNRPVMQAKNGKYARNNLFMAHESNKCQSFFFLDPVKNHHFCFFNPPLMAAMDAGACLLIHGANDVTIRHQDHHMPSTLAGDLTKPVVS